MGCCAASTAARGPQTKPVGELPSKEEANASAVDVDVEEVKDHMPEPGLPTLLESAFQIARSHEDHLETVSSASSRPTTISAIPTPSIPASNVESFANSSLRAEVDKESARISFTVGAPSGPSVAPSSICGRWEEPSVCGTLDGSKHDLESMSIVGSIAESRIDSQAYLQELEARLNFERKGSDRGDHVKPPSLHEEDEDHCFTNVSEGPPLDGSSYMSTTARL